MSLSFGTWQSNYANTWLQGGSYCSWPGVGCGTGTYACCNSYAGQFPVYYGTPALVGVNCTVGGQCGYGPGYGGQPSPGGNYSIVSLSFSGVGLSGTLPASFGNLAWLTFLNLQNEYNIVGSLPASFSQLARLQTLTLSGLRMNGTLDVLAPLPALASVSLGTSYSMSNFLFTGSLPSFVSQSLTTLFFSAMPQLQIPSWNLPSLVSLTLSNMQQYAFTFNASGSFTIPYPPTSFPPQLSLPALQQLSLQNLPGLYGTLPPAASYPNLVSLQVQSCQLNGTLPALPASLQTVSISSTPFTGTLDALASSSFRQLGSLSISGASLSGTIPATLVPALNNLTSCALTGNGLQCPLPAGLTKLACNPNSCH